MIGVYLPPENSMKIPGTHQVISFIYAAVNSDFKTLVCGDFNVGIDKKLDYIPFIDDVPANKVLDEKC